MLRYIQIGIWQLKLLAKYKVLTVAFILGGAYSLAFLLLPSITDERILSFLVFSDPSMLGFMFIGAMILFEKSDRTLSAQVITPMRTSEYLLSKSVALLLPSLICSLLMVVAARGTAFNPLPFLAATILTSLIFTLLGIAGAVRVDTFNQYIIVIPLFLFPLTLPLLNFFEITQLKILAIIPTEASLFLFLQSFGDPNPMKQLFAILYLTLWVYLAYRFAKKSFEQKMYR